MAAQPPHLVFAYGTLRQGFSNHHLVAESPCLGRAETTRRYALYLGRYPYCLKRQPLAPVRGEVYRVDDAGLAALDRLEGHPEVYYRERVPVRLDSGGTALAWLYFHPQAEGELLSHGDYARHADP